MANISNSPATIVNLTWSGAAAAPLLNQYSYSIPSDPVDNVPVPGSSPPVVSALRGILRLNFSISQTTDAVKPNRVGVALLPILDGTSAAVPPGKLTIPPNPSNKIVSAILRNGGYQIVDLGADSDGFLLGPFNYAFQLYNGTGYPWTGSLTATLYLWNWLNA